MRAAMTSAVARFAPVARQRARVLQLIGLAVASAVPAVLWVIIVEAIAVAIGSPLSLRTLIVMGTGIATFLALVCAPIVLRNHD